MSLSIFIYCFLANFTFLHLFVSNLGNELDGNVSPAAYSLCAFFSPSSPMARLGVLGLFQESLLSAKENGSSGWKTALLH